MAVDVTAILASRSNGKSAGFIHSDSYNKALDASFKKKFATAGDIISEAIASNPDSEDRFHNYRLWIEVLAEQGDRASLLFLGEHLFDRGQEEPESNRIYAALRGLIHLELDEFSAARLVCQALRSESPSPYSLELDQLVTNRQVEKVSVPALATAKMPLYDYFHLQSLARGLYQAGEAQALKEVLDHTAVVWPSSPLKLTFAMHQGFEAGKFGVAQDAAEGLAAINKDNGDYFYFTGVAQLKSGNFKGALESLTRASKLVGESDGEILSLIGQCHVALGDLQKAESILKRSISLIQSEGYPATRERLALASVEEELRGDALNPALEMPRTTRMWLVNLSPRRYFELQNAQESEIEHILRPMGATPNQGDFCFFATTVDLASGGQQWKIGAIYTVDSEPIWHPTEKYQNSLQLVARPPGGIPVDVVLLEDEVEDAATGEEGSHPYSFGVFELEMGALDIITEAVRMKNEGIIEESVSVKGRVG